MNITSLHQARSCARMAEDVICSKITNVDSVYMFTGFIRNGLSFSMTYTLSSDSVSFKFRDEYHPIKTVADLDLMIATVRGTPTLFDIIMMLEQYRSSHGIMKYADVGLYQKNSQFGRTYITWYPNDKAMAVWKELNITQYINR